MNRRALHRQQTETDIVDAAEALVLDDPESLTIHGVARAIGVTPGALYRYFPGIDAIVTRVQARVITDLLAAVDQAVDAVPAAHVLARVLAMADATVAFAAAQPTRYALLARMLAVPQRLVGDEAAATVLPTAVLGLTRMRTHLEVARASGALGPGDDTTRLLVLWASLHGSIQLGKLGLYAPEVRTEALARSAVDTLLVGWGADAAAVKTAREGACR